MPRGRRKAEPLPPQANDQQRKERQVLIKAKTDFIIAEQYKISTIQEGIKAARGVLRSLGHKAVDFAVAKRLYELEVEERQKSLASIREMCEALGVGGQVNFLDALQAQANDDEAEVKAEEGGDDAEQQEDEGNEVGDEPAGDGQPVPAGDGDETVQPPEADHGEVGAAPASDEELDEAGKTHKAGFDAGYAGADFEANPHKKGRVPYKLWAKGWEAGSTKRLGEQDAVRHQPATAGLDAGPVDEVLSALSGGALSAETAAAGTA